ncbi:MAG: hypothetical protein ACTS73_01255 [Arsenophonus sp. NEOnobi-MAG3]
MMMNLYRQATTTPKISTALQASKEPTSTLAKLYRISELTVAKGKKRDDIDDHCHILHCLPTTLLPAKEVIVIFLQKNFFSPSTIY